MRGGQNGCGVRHRCRRLGGWDGRRGRRFGDSERGFRRFRRSLGTPGGAFLGADAGGLHRAGDAHRLFDLAAVGAQDQGLTVFGKGHRGQTTTNGQGRHFKTSWAIFSISWTAFAGLEILAELALGGGGILAQGEAVAVILKDAAVGEEGRQETSAGITASK